MVFVRRGGALVGAALLACAGRAAQARLLWPMEAHDPQHSGWAGLELADTQLVPWGSDLRLKWRAELGAGSDAGQRPALSPDGATLFVCESGGVGARETRNGTLRWHSTASGSCRLTNNRPDSTPSVSIDGSKVFVLTASNRLFALNASSGAALWDIANANGAGTDPWGFVAESPLGVLCVRQEGGHFRGVSAATGQVLWVYNDTEPSAVGPTAAISRDGTICYGHSEGDKTYAGGFLFAINVLSGALVKRADHCSSHVGDWEPHGPVSVSPLDDGVWVEGCRWNKTLDSCDCEMHDFAGAYGWGYGYKHAPLHTSDGRVVWGPGVGDYGCCGAELVYWTTKPLTMHYLFYVFAASSLFPDEERMYGTTGYGNDLIVNEFNISAQLPAADLQQSWNFGSTTTGTYANSLLVIQDYSNGDFYFVRKASANAAVLVAVTRCNYCPAGEWGCESCAPCPPGYFCTGQHIAPQKCPGGFQYNAAHGSLTSAATCAESAAPCPGGRYCPPALLATSEAPSCPAGTYATATTLAISADDCLPCGSDGYYCPESSAVPVPVDAASHCAVGPSEDRRENQVPCGLDYHIVATNALEPLRIQVGTASSYNVTIVNKGVLSISWATLTRPLWLIPFEESGTLAANGSVTFPVLFQTALQPSGSFVGTWVVAWDLPSVPRAEPRYSTLNLFVDVRDPTLSPTTSRPSLAPTQSPVPAPTLPAPVDTTPIVVSTVGLFMAAGVLYALTSMCSSSRRLRSLGDLIFSRPGVVFFDGLLEAADLATDVIAAVNVLTRSADDPLIKYREPYLSFVIVATCVSVGHCWHPRAIRGARGPTRHPGTLRRPRDRRGNFNRSAAGCQWRPRRGWQRGWSQREAVPRAALG